MTAERDEMAQIILMSCSTRMNPITAVHYANNLIKAGYGKLPEREQMTETALPEARDTEIGQGLRELVQVSGDNSKAHGFHDEWPSEEMGDSAKEVRLHIAEKLALIHEEISEALGEIRSGKDPKLMYFVDKTGGVYTQQLYVDGVPQRKPEGFVVELADAIIRISDLIYLVDAKEELVEAQRIKHEYNATRPYKHGRKF